MEEEDGCKQERMDGVGAGGTGDKTGGVDESVKVETPVERGVAVAFPLAIRTRQAAKARERQ